MSLTDRLRFLLVIFWGGGGYACNGRGDSGGVCGDQASLSDDDGITIVVGIGRPRRAGGSAVLVAEPQPRGGFVTGYPTLGEEEGGDLLGERGEDIRALYPNLGDNRPLFANVGGAGSRETFANEGEGNSNGGGTIWGLRALGEGGVENRPLFANVGGARSSK